MEAAKEIIDSLISPKSFLVRPKSKSAKKQTDEIQ